MHPLHVASVQMESVPMDKAANFAKIRQLTSEAIAQGANVVVFPELCTTGYWHLLNLSENELRTLAEPVPEGPSAQQLIELARQHNATIGAGIVEVAADGRMYNTYVVALPNGQTHRHRKLHSFESDHLSSGSEFTVFDTPYGWKFGVLICYDCNLVENVRITKLLGAQLLLAPHQTGGCDYKSNKNIMGLVDREKWDNRHNDPAAIEAEFRGQKGRGWLTTWLPARAHDNGLFIAFSNGVGPDGDEVRTGNAMILDPFGRIIAETWKAADAIVSAELDPALLHGTLGDMFIRTRRPELYAPLTERTGAEQDVRQARFAEEFH
ncbi:MAG: nitrilase-related carbon-nitrogen hydrolase [Prosthecobacter sp.]|nr:nitrilase-related carbon-nitrogen hydrolase [Prosthecobacter sp.]